MISIEDAEMWQIRPAPHTNKNWTYTELWSTALAYQRLGYEIRGLYPVSYLETHYDDIPNRDISIGN